MIGMKGWQIFILNLLLNFRRQLPPAPAFVDNKSPHDTGQGAQQQQKPVVNKQLDTGM